MKWRSRRAAARRRHRRDRARVPLRADPRGVRRATSRTSRRPVCSWAASADGPGATWSRSPASRPSDRAGQAGRPHHLRVAFGAGDPDLDGSPCRPLSRTGRRGCLHPAPPDRAARSPGWQPRSRSGSADSSRGGSGRCTWQRRCRSSPPWSSCTPSRWCACEPTPTWYPAEPVLRRPAPRSDDRSTAHDDHTARLAESDLGNRPVLADVGGPRANRLRFTAVAVSRSPRLSRGVRVP